KSLQKTPPSGLSSRLARLSEGLLAAAAERPAVKPSSPGFGESPRRVSRDRGSNGAGGSLSEATALVGNGGDNGARLRLLEGFVSRTDLADCAQLALQWLADELEIDQ